MANHVDNMLLCKCKKLIIQKFVSLKHVYMLHVCMKKVRFATVFFCHKNYKSLSIE